MGIDRFGNPHAPNLSYARGGILLRGYDAARSFSPKSM
jgi:hypothetical protein